MVYFILIWKLRIYSADLTNSSNSFTFINYKIFIIKLLQSNNFKNYLQVSNHDAKRLYEDLINGYNKLVRPVGNNSERLIVYMGLKLTQLLDVVFAQDTR